MRRCGTCADSDSDSDSDSDAYGDTHGDRDAYADTHGDRDSCAADGGAPTLQQVDGGAGYYARFSSPFPSSSDFFPIGTWGSYNLSAGNLDSDRAAGLNTYVWNADQGTDESLLRARGMYSLPNDEQHAQFQKGSETTGYVLGDEVDMCCGPPGFVGGNGYQMLTNAHNGLPADGRARYANFGKGVMFWESDADAARFVNLPFLNLVSNDIYWFTDPNERSRNGYGLAAAYGWTVDKMRRLDAMDGQIKPIWNFVEVGWPFTESAAAGGRTIAPAEARAAVWHSIIAGARGIIYFNHSFGGPCTTHHVLRSTCGNYPAVRQTVTEVGQQIRNLAPVLNAPSVASHTQTSAGVRALYKWHDGNVYVLAGNRENVSRTGTMGLPCIGNGATAVKLGEDNERIPVIGGTFMDEFNDGNAIHVYRIDGGSRCGL